MTVSALAWSTAGLFTRLIPLDSWTMLVWRGIFGAIGIAVVNLRSSSAAMPWEEFRRMSWPSWLYAAIRIGVWDDFLHHLAEAIHPLPMLR